MIIGISGPQGAGKSTLLAELINRGCFVDPFRVSRAVQASLGWDSLTRVEDNPADMVSFQNEVFKLKLENDILLSEDKKLIFTERTFGDIFSYAALWANKFKEQNKWSLNDAVSFLQDFNGKCITAQEKTYHRVIVLPFMEHMVFEKDPHRASFEDIGEFQRNLDSFNERTHVSVAKLQSKSVPERADEVLTHVY